MTMKIFSLDARFILVWLSGCIALLAGCESGSGLGGGGPIEIWAADEAREIALSAQPVRENEVFSAPDKSIRLRAASNDAVAFQLALRSESSGNVDVVVSDLQGPASVLAAKDVIRRYRVHPVRVENFRSWYPAHTGRPTTPIDVPDVLVPWDAPRGGGPIELAAGMTVTAWVDVLIPPGTQPGRYRGSVQVRRASAALFGTGKQGDLVQNLTLEVSVAPVEIPSGRSLAVIARVDPRQLLTAHLRWPSDTPEETRFLPDVASHQAAIRLVNATMGLFHDHACTPVLWASFPKYRPTDERTVEIDWSAYDALAEGWIDGGGYGDKAPSVAWPLPVSADYPDAERNGGFGSPRYARLLAAYMSACQKHFVERGWDERGFVRIAPPRALTGELVEQTRRLTGILRQSEAAAPLVAHFAPGSLRTLGWYNAPTVELADVGIWCPPASQWQPDRMAGGGDARRWFQPTDPPYSPSLDVAAPPADARAVAWQAFRYGADGVWIENAAMVGARGGSGEGLVYAGQDFGVVHAPLASVRLKRLRRSILDYELLRLLDRGGKSLLAKRTAEQMVSWGFTDACTRNLVTTRSAGWAADPFAYGLARNIILQELGADTSAGDPQTDAILTGWARFMNQGRRLEAEAVGVRLEEEDSGLKGHIFATLLNTTALSMSGRWDVTPAPAGWTRLSESATESGAQSSSLATITFGIGALTYNALGVLDVPLRFEGDSGESSTVARLAVTQCPLVDSAPDIDGDLSDWVMAATNAAGDFRLVRGEGSAGGGAARVPLAATKALFCMDLKRMYVAVFCATPRGESPRFRSDNLVTIDGAIPWGQDLVEVLLSPRNARAGGGGELLVLQIKPSGVVVGRKGALTDPPMNASEPWQSGAQVAARVSGEGWTVELSIPLAALEPATSKTRVWGCNVTRLDSRRGEYSSWSGARGNAYSPETLGNLLVPRP